MRKVDSYDPFNPYISSDEYLRDLRDRHFVILPYFGTDIPWYVSQNMDPLSVHYIRVSVPPVVVEVALVCLSVCLGCSSLYMCRLLTIRPWMAACECTERSLGNRVNTSVATSQPSRPPVLHCPSMSSVGKPLPTLF